MRCLEDRLWDFPVGLLGVRGASWEHGEVGLQCICRWGPADPIGRCGTEMAFGVALNQGKMTVSFHPQWPVTGCRLPQGTGITWCGGQGQISESHSEWTADKPSCPEDGGTGGSAQRGSAAWMIPSVPGTHTIREELSILSGFCKHSSADSRGIGFFDAKSWKSLEQNGVGGWVKRQQYSTT